MSLISSNFQNTYVSSQAWPLDNTHPLAPTGAPRDWSEHNDMPEELRLRCLRAELRYERKALEMKEVKEAGDVVNEFRDSEDHRGRVAA